MTVPMNASHDTHSFIKLIRTALFAVFLAQSQSAMSDGFRITPLKLYFDANSNSSLLKIKNDGNQKVNLQLEAMTWNQSDEGEDLYMATREIIFFPKILSIDANSERIVRVGYQGVPADTKEKSYRLFVQELPFERPGEAQMKFAVRVSIPVFVRPVENEHAWNVGFVSLEKQGLSIRVNNTGNRFLMVGAMQAIGRDAEGKEILRSEGQGWYVLAGRGRAFSLLVNKESCEKVVTLEVAITVNKDTRKRPLNEINCELLDNTISQSPQVAPGK